MNIPLSPQCYRYPHLVSSFDEDDEEEPTPFLDLTELQLSLLSGEEKRGSNSGSICFSDSPEVIEFSVHTDDIGQNRHDLWYKRSEMKKFRGPRKAKSIYLRASRDTPKKDDCDEALEERKSPKSVVEAVLSAQHEQEREGNLDPDVISCISRSLSSSSVNAAIERGLRLQNDVQSIR